MPTLRRTELGLYDARGHRKYLTTAERTAFLRAAEETSREGAIPRFLPRSRHDIMPVYTGQYDPTQRRGCRTHQRDRRP